MRCPARKAHHQSRLRRSSIAFYGIAATGSYDHFDSLRDAPPEGEAPCGGDPSDPAAPGQLPLQGSLKGLKNEKH